MATTRQRSQMSAVCVPSGRFSSDALDASASTYTETGLDVGVPVAVDVSSNHTLRASTVEGVSSAYAFDLRVADDSSGPFYGRDCARWLYRDTTLTGAANDWKGWADLDTVTDVEGVNQAEGGGSNQHQHPSAVTDKHGNLYVFFKHDTRVRCYVKSGSSGAWGSVVTVVTAAQNGSTSNSDRVDGWPVYVEEDDALYVFWPSWDSARTKQSVGVSVTTDQGSTWRLLTNAIVGHSDSLDFSPEILRRIRVIYNPRSRVFTLTFEYDDNTDEWVYTTTVDRTFTATDWGPSPLRYRQLHAVVVDPRDGREYMLAPTDDGTGAIVDLGLYSKAAGALAWSSELTSWPYSGLDTATGVTGFTHHNGEPMFMFGDASSGEAQALWVYQANGLRSFDAAGFEFAASPLAAGASNLHHWNVVRWRDRYLAIGNPSGGNTDEIVALHLGGWQNLPTIAGDVATVGGWDVPSNQGGITWTEDDTGTGVVESNWDAGYLSLETYTPGGLGNDGRVSGSAPGAPVATLVTLKVEVDDGYPTVGSADVEGYVYFRIVADNGSQSVDFFLALSETRFNVIDNNAGPAPVGSNVTAALLGVPYYFKIAVSAASADVAVWTSTDGATWSQAYSVTLATGSSSGAGVDYEFGVFGDSNVVSTRGYWQLVSVEASTSATAIQALIDYADADDAYTSTIDLEGMPIGTLPNYIAKGAYLAAEGTQASAGDLWTAASVAKQGVRNALIDGDDSPRVRWVQSSATAASLVWDTSDAPLFLRRGFLWVTGKCVTGVTLTQDDTGGGSTTLVNKANSVTLAGNWARSGNVIRPNAAGSSLVWYERNALAGSYIYDGVGVFLPILGNSAGYWSTDQGAGAMRITVDGAVGSFASSGSSCQLVPRDFLILWSTNDVGDSADGVTLALSAFNATAALDVGKVLIGEFFPMPSHPAGRGRAVIPNHARETTPGGYSYSEKLGPTAGEWSFTVRDFSRGSVRYAAQSSVQTVQLGFDATTPYADAHETLDTLASIVEEVGTTTPIIFAPLLTSKPGTGSSAVLVPFARRALYGYFASGRLDITSESGVAFGDEILSSSTFTVRGIT